MENIKESPAKENLQTDEDKKGLNETDRLAKKEQYRYFTRNISRYDPEYSIKQAMKKRLACRSFDGYIENNGMRSKFMAAMRQFSKRCQKLQFSIRLNDVNSNKEWIKLREILKRQDCVRKICLDPLTTQITEEQFLILAENLKNLRAIKNLQILFETILIQDEGLQKFGQCLKRIITLKHLEFGCILDETTTKGFQALGNGLKRLNFLENIKLSFSEFQSTVFEGLGQSLKGMRSQANVHLFFSNLSVDLAMPQVIKKRLKECSWIQNLRIEFHVMGQAENGGLQRLGQSFEALPLLKHLSLRFPQVIRKEPFEMFCKGLQSLFSLESLKLHFTPCYQIQDWEVLLLSQSLTKLCSLEDLTLNFLHSGEISDDGLQILGQTIGDLPLLKSISLSVSSEKHCFTKIGFEKLKEGLRRAKSLEKIELCLKNFPDVENQDIDQFMQNLQALSSLVSVVLYFERFQKLKKEGLDAIEKSLKAMSCVQNVKLSFFWLTLFICVKMLILFLCRCNLVSQQDVANLVKSLKELPIRVSCSHNYNEIN